MLKLVMICDPTPANEALCGKINFELWAEMWSEGEISQNLKYAKKQSLTWILWVHELKLINKWQEIMF